jgi:hypothetical protein
VLPHQGQEGLFDLVGITKIMKIPDGFIGKTVAVVQFTGQQARDVFEMRYQETVDPDKDRWELCSSVLARRDVVDRLSIPW